MAAVGHIHPWEYVLDFPPLDLSGLQVHTHRALIITYCSDDSSSSLMAAAVANESCDPFTVRELPCEPGDTITYSVNASDASDFAKAISFARERNIRLVVRNTGHE
jgi:hypothetical protein